MDVLKYKTVNATEGVFTVSTGGLNLAQIVAVKRQGLNYDKVGFLNIDDNAFNWTYISFGKRIRFNSSFPFQPDEKIYIMYKVTT